MKRFSLLLLLFFAAMLVEGCYWQHGVEQNQVALLMSDGVNIDQVVGPGRYTDMGYRADIQKIDTNVQTWEFNDPSLVTRDKQPIGLTVSISARRPSDPETVTRMYQDYRSEAQNDEAFRALVNSRIPRAIKEATARYSLDQLLGTGGGSDVGRATFTNDIAELLEEEIAETGARLVDVGVSDLQVSDSFADSLEAKAAVQAEREKSQQEKIKLEADLDREKIQTEIELEKARRDRLVSEEEARVLQESPELLRIRMAELLTEALGDKDKVFFVPEGSDLTFFLTPEQSGRPIPVPGN